MDGVPEKGAPTSTAVGAAIVNAVMARAVEKIAQSGMVPPIFMSANLDQGDEHNRKMLAELAVNDKAAFVQLTETAKKALA